MPVLEVNGVSLHYEVRGRGIPLLLIAGLASDSRSWLPVIDELASHCRVITPDNRGSGRTSPLFAETSIGAMAADCIALVEHLGLERINLLGHSMGGFIAQECAIRRPDRFDNLILEATTSRNSNRNNDLFSSWAGSLEAGLDLKLWFRSIFHWIFSPRFFDDEEAVADALRFAVEYPYPQTPVAFRNQVGAIAAFDSTDRLSRITARTLVISGKEDLLIPVQACEILARKIPGAVFTEIAGAAHSIHMEDPHAFTRAVLDFLLLS